LTKPCWVSKPTGFVFQNRSVQPSGVQSLELVAGVGGKASVVFKEKGASLMAPDPSGFTGPIDVQLRKSSGAPCWGHGSAPVPEGRGGRPEGQVGLGPSLV